MTIDTTMTRKAAPNATAMQFLGQSQKAIIFRLENEYYACAVDRVREIVHRKSFAHMPGVSLYIIGVVELRNQNIPIFNIKKFLGLPKTMNHADVTILVIEIDSMAAGLCVDAVEAVSHVRAEQIESKPPTLRGHAKSVIQSVVNLQGCFISMLDVKLVFEHLTNHHFGGSIMTPSKDLSATSLGQGRYTQETREAQCQLVSFNIREDEFAVDIGEVQEIIKMQSITHVPKAPSFVEGVINLRGVIVPIMSLRERFGIEKTENTKSTRIMIINLDDKRIGLIVDAVSEVLRIAVSAIKEPPQDAIGESAGFVKGMVNVGDRLIIVLDLPKVLSAHEVASIDHITALVSPSNGEAIPEESN
jgi:purine-binding chemotaxis protein CheW